MSQFPGQPPRPLGYAVPPAVPAVNLPLIAERQRMLMFAVLGYVGLIVLNFVIPADLKLVVGIAMIAVSITASVFIFMLALTLYNTGTGVVLGLLTLIPLIGLIVLLVINSKATSLLQRNGYKVGLLGAKLPS